jgi:predicted translin family RNA/ssDNA-binding protein
MESESNTGDASGVANSQAGGGGRPVRRRRAGSSAKEREGPLPSDSAIILAFKQYATVLDDMNDRRERLVKISRDITIGSKRLIFLLHRFLDDPEEITQKADEDLKKIHENFARIAQELQGQDYYRYLRAFSPGIQEYIEAVSFFEYLKSGRLILKDKIESDIRAGNPQNLFLPITVYDYAMGIADLSGELMRLCVNSVATGSQDQCERILAFMEDLYTWFSQLQMVGEFSKKLSVMKDSLQKVEKVCFTIKVRGSEYPKEFLAGLIDSKEGPEDEGTTD